MNNQDSILDLENREIMENNLSSIQQPNGKFKLLQKMAYYENPLVIYKPENSNKKQAQAASLRLYKKLLKNGKLEEYQREITKAIEIGTLTKVEDPHTVFSNPHHFCLHGIVVSETSMSTKVRLINNTSTVSHSVGTLMSVNTRYPSRSLNDIGKCVFNLMLFDHKISADIEKCYRKILVDPLTANLRLFCRLDYENKVPKFIYF